MVLEAKSLACERGGRLIFKDLSFTIRGGEAVELRGPNGAGKSSLLRLLAGLNKPVAGGLSLAGQTEEVATQAHYIGHQEAVKPALTVKENLEFWARFQGGSANLAPFKIQHLAEDDARLLSEGQRRRLSLSRLVSVKRPLWLLDEPTVGLDQTALADLRGVIDVHLAQGGLVIAATHSDLGPRNTRMLKLEARR
ncbi:MAG: heme ABC exporter ATP-binding protein CcmA [Aestuariivirga sp.]